LFRQERQGFQIQVGQYIGIKQEMELGAEIFFGDSIPKEHQNWNLRQWPKDTSAFPSSWVNSPPAPADFRRISSVRMEKCAAAMPIAKSDTMIINGTAQMHENFSKSGSNFGH